MGQEHELTLRAIGRVVRGLEPEPQKGARAATARERWEEGMAEIEIDPIWAGALVGIEDFSHIWIVWWLDRSPLQMPSESLRIHPEGREEMPLVGIFATRSPRRPNPVAFTAVRLLERSGTRLRVQGLDAWEGTPIIDIKPYLRRGDLIPDGTVPEWLEQLWHMHDEEHGL